VRNQARIVAVNWQAVAAVVSLVVAVGTAAYTFGVLKTRVDDQAKEIERARDRVDRLIDSNWTPPHSRG